MLEINRNLGSSLDLDEVLPRILESLFRIFPQADRGYILLATDRDGELEARAIKDRRDDAGEPITLNPVSHTIAQRVIQEGKAILSEDVAADTRFDVSESVLDIPVRSVMCAPMIGPSRKPLGVIHIYTEDPSRQFGEADTEVLVGVAMLAGQAIEHAHSHAALLELDRRERELATARQVQLHFLPKHRPDVEGYDFFHYYHPADGVAGDYFDYIRLPDDRLAVTMADVAGKGMSAALLMARFCSDVRYCLARHHRPGRRGEFSQPGADRPRFGRSLRDLCAVSSRSGQAHGDRGQRGPSRPVAPPSRGPRGRRVGRQDDRYPVGRRSQGGLSSFADDARGGRSDPLFHRRCERGHEPPTTALRIEGGA